MIKNSSFIYRTCCALLCILLLASLFCIGAQADTLRKYRVTVDDPINAVTENTPAIIRGATQSRDTLLKIAGWIQTDYKIDHYLYTLDGGKTWVRDDNAVRSRPDTKHFNPDTYPTAGFHLEIDVSGLLDGTYDLFLRAVTSRNDTIDVLAMLDMTVGNVDTNTISFREINLARLSDQSTLLLKGNASISLGGHNMNNFNRAEIITSTNATLTLSSADKETPYPFANASVTEAGEDGTFKHVVDLFAVRYAGEILLSTDKEVHVSQIRFYYNTPDYYTGDLVIHMTYSPYENLGGMNAAAAALRTDDTVGTHTRIYPTKDGNDPYVYFSIGTYLKTAKQVVTSADHYRYAVITVQTPETNSSGYFRLFLCAGAIRGPSGNSSIAFQPVNDGQWHRYIIPLCEEDDWTGQIHGIRFDFIDGNVTTSDYANIASLGFYPDYDSALAASKQPFEVFHEGEPPADRYHEENRAPSGRADRITWFDSTLAPCFKGMNKVEVSFDTYGHLLISATEATNDPYVSFDMQNYAAITGQPLLSADQYKYIVLRIMADESIDGKQFTLYYYADGYDYAQGTRAVGAYYEAKDWEYLTYNMQDKPNWAQDILGMRLDISSMISSGQTMCISEILFFEDEAAWFKYAKENGIKIEGGGYIEEEKTTVPETEAPTIEIPTQGPGLEYVPPEQQQTSTPSQGCRGTLVFSGLILPLCALAYLSFRAQKRTKP